MDVKTVTTKTHSATFSADDMKAVALSAVKKQVGVVDDTLLSSDASIAADGSIEVKIVEAVPAATEALSPAATPSIQIPSGLGGIPMA